MTRYLTVAPSILLPAKALACPVTVTLSPKLKLPSTGLNVVSNFGRLYSSTLKYFEPFSEEVIRILPSKPLLGAVNDPLTVPNSLVTNSSSSTF